MKKYISILMICMLSTCTSPLFASLLSKNPSLYLQFDEQKEQRKDALSKKNELNAIVQGKFLTSAFDFLEGNEEEETGENFADTESKPKCKNLPGYTACVSAVTAQAVNMTTNCPKTASWVAVICYLTALIFEVGGTLACKVQFCD